MRAISATSHPARWIQERRGIIADIVKMQSLNPIAFAIFPEAPIMPGRVPSDRTIQIAEAIRTGRTHKDIAEEFGVSWQRVGQIRLRFDLPTRERKRRQRGPNPRLWTDDELAFVVKHQGDAIDDIATALGRTPGAVQAMRQNFVRRGLVAPRRRLLTDFDDQFISDLALSTSEVAAKTGRSAGTIRGIRYRRRTRELRKTTVPKVESIRQPVNFWTPDEVAHLARNHHRMAKEIAIELGRSTKAVKNKRQALWGADRPKE